MENTLTVLAIPVPPEPILEQAVGYRNDRNAHYLALWWEPCGDEAMVSDGFVTFTGHWPGYLAYVQHVSVHPHLAAYTLGSSEDMAMHWLVIDLQERQASVALRREAEIVLATQWKSPEGMSLGDPYQAKPIFLTSEDLEHLLEKMIEQSKRVPTMEELMSHMEEDRKAVQALQQWLDDQMK